MDDDTKLTKEYGIEAFRKGMDEFMKDNAKKIKFPSSSSPSDEWIFLTPEEDFMLKKDDTEHIPDPAISGSRHFMDIGVAHNNQMQEQPQQTMEQKNYNFLRQKDLKFGTDEDNPYLFTEQTEVPADLPWVDDYKNNIMNTNIPKQRRRTKPKYIKSMFENISYNVDQLLSIYEKLEEKQIGNIAITGSLALFLQEKISRDTFSDIDITTISGKVELDDEFEDVRTDIVSYSKNGGTVSTPNTYLIDKVLVDIFPVSKSTVNIVAVGYNGSVYKCMDYKDIIDIKLKMLLPQMKDYNELYNNVFSLNYI